MQPAQGDKLVTTNASTAAARLATLGGWGGIAWLVGIALQLQQRSLWRVDFYVAGAVFVLLWVAASMRWGRAWHNVVQAVGWGLAMGLLGVSLTGLQAHWRLADALPESLEGRDLVVTGVIASLPQVTLTGQRFRFDVEEARTPDGAAVQVPALIQLGWYVPRPEQAGAIAAPDKLQAGERWRFTVRLRQPHGTFNPHGFDLELWLFEQGVRATGYVRGTRGTQAQRLATGVGYPVARLRQRLRDAIGAQVSDVRAAGVLAALAVGDQAAIARGDWDVFRATGVAHLISISGLHITMLAWLAGLAASALWRRVPRAMLWWPAPSAERWIGVGVACAYSVLAGWGVPAQRTVWMLATVTALGSIGRHWPWPMVLLSAAVVVSALDPWALLQPGFWLSFAAVGLLMASSGAMPASRGPTDRAGEASEAGAAEALLVGGVGRALRKLVDAAHGGLRTQWIATLGLAPLTLVLFQQFSVVGFLANLVAIPLVTLVITPLALLGVALPLLWPVAGWLVQQLAAGLAWLAAWPAAVVWLPVAPVWAQWLGLVAGALLMLPLPWRVRCMGLPMLLPLLLPLPLRPPPGQFDLMAVDVGQGNAVLVRTHGKTLLYDTGPRYSRDSDAGQRVLLPLLRALGVNRLDMLMLSHRDTDHVGGAAAVLAGVPVGALVSSLETRHELLQRPGARRCVAGQRWDWDGVQFEVLHPRAEDYGREGHSNAISCVLKIEGQGASALLVGDIEAAQEARLVAQQGSGASLHADVLLMPHHGSRTSSSELFLDAVQPQLAIAQAGYRNRFGHPVADVLARYEARGIGVVRSDRCGAWAWRSAGEPKSLWGSCQRQLSRRYWHHGSQVNPMPQEPETPDSTDVPLDDR